jgi:hypothetical protein
MPSGKEIKEDKNRDGLMGVLKDTWILGATK